MEIKYDSNGDGWEIGSSYEFSNDKENWYEMRLDGVMEGIYHPYLARVGAGITWRDIRECQTPAVAGSKHKKPADLIEGEWYKFHYQKERNLLGYYGSVSNDPGGRASRNGFCVGTTGVATFYIEEDCIGITHMIEAPNTLIED
jgi:hypothetical protein